MPTLNERLLAATLLACLASCNAVQVNPQEGIELTPTTPRFSLSAFHEDSQVDEVKLTPPGQAEETRKDVDRRRTGVRAAYGIEYVEGYLEVFRMDHLGDDVDFDTGVGLGVQAEINLHRFNNDTILFFPYRAGIVAAGGEDDFAGMKADFATIEFLSEVGIGVDYRGFRPSIGVMHKRLKGGIDFEGEPDDGDSLDAIDGKYLAGYLELAYRSPKGPFQVAVRGLSGDEEGLYASVGVGF
jgi:hypothetical protein